MTGQLPQGFASSPANWRGSFTSPVSCGLNPGAAGSELSDSMSRLACLLLLLALLQGVASRLHGHLRLRAWIMVLEGTAFYSVSLNHAAIAVILARPHTRWRGRRVRSGMAGEGISVPRASKCAPGMECAIPTARGRGCERSMRSTLTPGKEKKREEKEKKSCRREGETGVAWESPWLARTP